MCGDGSTTPAKALTCRGAGRQRTYHPRRRSERPRRALLRHQPRTVHSGRPATISRGRAIVSGRRFTTLASRRGGSIRGNRTNCSRSDAARRTSWRGPRRRRPSSMTRNLRAGRRRLERKVRRYRPRVVAIVGLGAYRVAFDRPRATLGLQPDTITGAAVWVLTEHERTQCQPSVGGLCEGVWRAADLRKGSEGKGQRAEGKGQGQRRGTREKVRGALLPALCPCRCAYLLAR